MRFFVITAVVLAAFAAPSSVLAQASTRWLALKTDLVADGASLSGVLDQLAEKHKFTYQVSPQVEKDDLADKISLDIKSVTLKSALDVLCAYQGALTWTVEGKQLTLHYVDDALQLVYPVTYDIRRLRALLADPVHFQDVIMAGTPNAYWNEVDGAGGRIAGLTPQAMQVFQSREGHESVAELLERLTLAAAGRTVPAYGPVELKLARTLAKRVTIPAGEYSLNEFLELTLKANGIPYWMTPEYNYLDAVNLVEPIDSDGKPAAIGDLVKKAVAPSGFTLRLEDECVRILEQEESDEMWVSQVYNIRRQLGRGLTGDGIVQSLMATPQLGPWALSSGVGGDATWIGSLLVVVHTPEKQQAIATLLSK